MTQKEVKFYFNKFVVDDIMGRLDEVEAKVRKTKAALRELLELQGMINIKEEGEVCPECESPFPGRLNCPKCGPYKQKMQDGADEEAPCKENG